MTHINISLINNCNLQKDVVATLNHFHFRKIRLTEGNGNVQLHAGLDGLVVRCNSNSLAIGRQSVNSLIVIQDELDRYKKRRNEILPNRNAPTPEHVRPFVDELADEIEETILSFMDVEFGHRNPRPFGVVLSHDVDGIGKFYWGSLKSAVVFLGNALRLWKRPVLAVQFLVMSIRFGSGHVDYYGFDLILKVAARYNFKPLLFFYAHLETGNKLSLWERLKGVNPNYELKNIRLIVEKLKEFGAEIGLHGSYKSANSLELFRKEKEALENELHVSCRSTRQHYLNSYGGATLDIYSQSGITYDYTCGVVYENAFFCATCRPFYYRPFLVQEHVVVIPMVYMDAVSLYFDPATKAEMYHGIDSLLVTLKKYGGFASFNFHQRMISALPAYYDLYEYLASRTIEMEGEILSATDLDRIYGME